LIPFRRRSVAGGALGTGLRFDLVFKIQRQFRNWRQVHFLAIPDFRLSPLAVHTADVGIVVDGSPLHLTQVIPDAMVGIDGLKSLPRIGEILAVDVFPPQIERIKVFDINGSGAVTLTLDAESVVNVVDGTNALTGVSKSIVVGGGSDDTVDFNGNWTWTGSDLVNGIATNKFADGDAIVFVEVGVNISSPTVGVIALSSLSGVDGFVVNGIDPSDYADSVVSAGGDVNGDGFADFLISADRANGDIGETYVVFGGSDVGSGSTIDLSDLDGSNGFVMNGIDVGDQSGFGIGAAGDINGDGVGDIIVGAMYGDPASGADAGESYVVFGKAQSQSFSASLELSGLDGANGFVINGIDADDLSGFAVNGAGDVNGDGIDDILVSAQSAEFYGLTNAGETYVIFGGGSVGSSGTQRRHRCGRQWHQRARLFGLRSEFGRRHQRRRHRRL